jgi:hypothetical protein
MSYGSNRVHGNPSGLNEKTNDYKHSDGGCEKEDLFPSDCHEVYLGLTPEISGDLEQQAVVAK